ncbi:Limulus clotting factor C, partial [Stegodyphus mimosarum]
MKSIGVFSCFMFVACLTICEGHLIVKDGIVGIGLDLGKFRAKNDGCSYENITCPCGLRGAAVIVAIPLCSEAGKSILAPWKKTCEPCDDLKPEDICPRYQNCRQCHADGREMCAACPDGQFGTWCENVCTCVNGGVCTRDGKCQCPYYYEGQNCEKRKGCSPPNGIIYPLQVTLSPSDRPVTAVYSCPEDYELSGTAVSICLPDDEWSSEPPVCFKRCPLLSSPANGKLTFSANILVEGVTADITCNPFHRLIGQKKLACLANGQWSTELPIC